MTNSLPVGWVASHKMHKRLSDWEEGDTYVDTGIYIELATIRAFYVPFSFPPINSYLRWSLN